MTDGGLTNGEVLGDISHCMLSFGEEPNDPNPRGIPEGLECSREKRELV
jgi:hypothetical protein